jgi:hypothetical protein
MSDTKDEVQEALGPVASEWATHVRDALTEFVTDLGPARHKLSKSSEAFIISDLLRLKFAGAYPDLRDAKGKVGIFKKGNRFLVVVENGKLVVKIKKLNSALLTSKSNTDSYKNFVEQQPCLPGFSMPTNLHLGYQVQNEAEVASSKIFIVRPNGAKLNSWHLEIKPSAVDPAALAPVVPINKKKRVTVKKSAKNPAPKPAKRTGDDNGSGGE